MIAKALLFGAWALFILSLVLILLGFLLSLRNYDLMGRAISSLAADPYVAPGVVLPSSVEAVRRILFLKAPRALSWWSVGCLLAGVVALLWFVGANLPL